MESSRKTWWWWVVYSVVVEDHGRDEGETVSLEERRSLLLIDRGTERSEVGRHTVSMPQPHRASHGERRIRRIPSTSFEGALLGDEGEVSLARQLKSRQTGHRSLLKEKESLVMVSKFGKAKDLYLFHLDHLKEGQSR